MNAGHKAAVLGLVGMTISGGYFVGSGILELRQRRMEGANAPKAAFTAKAATNATK
eukprot:CAMPEP_0171629470 /NCGR_PEP_ID=MMETSP0990-20121206/22197_1 /TAXON_ID=483369 /ORGANISM="non described non described, Strain CCMP2098" /LENGTH=55 /DNA_ID=CAMNT_0012198143 /DNA_START=76 /DNA_END=243 /DNA_ORIENTATION=-